MAAHFCLAVGDSLRDRLGPGDSRDLRIGRVPRHPLEGGVNRAADVSPRAPAAPRFGHVLSLALLFTLVQAPERGRARVADAPARGHELPVRNLELLYSRRRIDG